MDESEKFATLASEAASTYAKPCRDPAIRAALEMAFISGTTWAITAIGAGLKKKTEVTGKGHAE